MSFNETDGIKAWNIHNQIIENEKTRRELIFQNAELIHTLHDTKLYQAILGDEEAPWTAYIGQPELFYSASKVYTLDKIYQKFIKELGFKIDELVNIPISKLSNLISIVDKDNVKEWLNKADVLTTQDFQDEIRVATGHESYLNCPHKNTVLYSICSSCGFRHKGEHEEIK
jgi:hypothetical protein